MGGEAMPEGGWGVVGVGARCLSWGLRGRGMGVEWLVCALGRRGGGGDEEVGRGGRLGEGDGLGRKRVAMVSGGGSVGNGPRGSMSHGVRRIVVWEDSGLL